jgi:hypothetical protein
MARKPWLTSTFRNPVEASRFSCV